MQGDRSIDLDKPKCALVKKMLRFFKVTTHYKCSILKTEWRGFKLVVFIIVIVIMQGVITAILGGGASHILAQEFIIHGTLFIIIWYFISSSSIK